MADSPALAWAVEKFGFDPASQGDRQGAVRELQSWLNESGAKVAADGLLGPATLAALERVYASLEQAAAATSGADATAQRPPEDDPLSEENKRRGRERLQKAMDDIAGLETENFKGVEEDEPGVTPEGDGVEDEEEVEEEEEAPDAESTSARPVALSDSAVEDVSQDRLGFAPYVEAVAEFILAEQTRPPLSLVINAQWGQGKTSFMNMMDRRLKEKSGETTVRVATTWFNPWKYSEPAQVWAAFVANVTRCVRANLTPRQLFRFKRARFVDKMKRHADFPLALRLTVALIFVVLVLSLPFTLDLPAFHASFKDDKGGILGAFYAATQATDGWLWWLLFIPFALLSVLYGYITFTKGLGLNLLEYVEKTDFKDKIGTLSQFESEMRRLADAVPKDLKIVVFIDDLDRCKGRVLGEIIEALQLADVSRTCIFVMGMDLRIVAHAIETERSELAASTGRTAMMEHGSGYKFLEKIIQARLSLPSHNATQMAQLVTSAMGGPEEQAVTAGPAARPPAPGQPPKREGVVAATLSSLTGGGREPRVTPSDSPAVVATAKYYGSRHFTNPRRLKRFINGFRLQAYLADAVQPDAWEVDRLARFLVLAEKWPALLHYLVRESKGANILDEPTADGTSLTMAGEIARLRKEDHKLIVELLKGRRKDAPLTAKQLQTLAAWCGFFYYPGIETKKKEEA